MPCIIVRVTSPVRTVENRTNVPQTDHTKGSAMTPRDTGISLIHMHTMTAKEEALVTTLTQSKVRIAWMHYLIALVGTVNIKHK